MPDLDGDGGFLKVHQLSDYLVGLGKPSDDIDNTFTGRLLLLLESQAIFGEKVYDRVLEECVDRYWIDYTDHSDSFIPAFLINDILRFWRTLCVSYEAGTTQDPVKRRAKNYKLKFSRLLTCYSAILAIQAEFSTVGTISSKKALEVLKMTPNERLEYSRKLVLPQRKKIIDELTGMYEGFLLETDCSKSDLMEKMKDPSYYKKSLEGARKYGDSMFELLQGISEDQKGNLPNWRFFRYITV